MVTSGTSSTFSSVCFVELSFTLRAGEKQPGEDGKPNALKNEKGERFTLPALSTVDANAMGGEQ
jgi:hypothetical protein